LDVFIIDNSYSMGYRFPRGLARTHLDQAKIIAHTLVSRMESGSEGAVLLSAANPAAEVIGQPTYDLSAINNAIDAIAQTAADTDLAGAMQKALAVAQRNSSQPNKRLFIFSDSTRSALENPQSADMRALAAQLARQYSITYFNLGQKDQQNLAVANVRAGDALVTTQFSTSLLADVRGFDLTSPTFLQWKLDGRLIGSTQCSPSSAGATTVLDNVTISAGGTHVLSVRAAADDPLAIDNISYRALNVVSQLKVLLVEGDRGAGAMTGSTGFLSIALAPAQSPGKPSDSYVQPTTISDLQLSSEVLGDYRAVVLANVPTVDKTEADALKAYVQGGGTLMIFMGELVNADNYNQMLLSRGLMPGALQRRMVAPAGSPFHFDFHADAPLHAMLSFLRNQPRSGLETAEISTYWQLSLPANSKVERVLEFKDEGGRSPDHDLSGTKDEKKSSPDSSLSVDPAITLQSLGSGRVLFVSTTADAQWTTLPAKPVYVPLMHELLRGAMVPDDVWMNATVGQQLSMPARIKMTAQPSLDTPDGKRMMLESTTTTPPIYQSPVLTEPGVYRLNVGSATYPIAVNPPTDEADVRTESISALHSIFGDAADIETDQPPVEIARHDESRDFGWGAMLAVLGLLGAECFMAMKFGHYRKGKENLATDGRK
jgi:von Willebrand factor type A domain